MAVHNSDLYKSFLSSKGRARKAHKWHHYFDIYERAFERFRGRDIVMIEVGVYEGGSLELWKNYFGSGSRIIGIDIDARAMSYAEPGVDIMIGDQADPEFLRSIINTIGHVDIVLDDGGHTANQQISTFEALYPIVKNPGIYLVEDTHTAFWGGEYDDRYDKLSFLDYAFLRCRSLHEWTMRRREFGRYMVPIEQRPDPKPAVSDFCRRTASIQFYDSIVLFERAERCEPWHELR